MQAEPNPSRAATLRVVVGLAFNDADGVAFDQAVSVAARVERSELHLVHVFDSEPSEARARELVDHLRLYVNEKAAALGGLRAMRVGIHLRSGEPVHELVKFASEARADLIVIGSHKGPHLKSWLVGSKAEHIVAQSKCPVMVAAPKPKSPAAQVPAIEPPCPDCLAARSKSDGASWWCERHSHPAKHAHTFSYQRELPYATHDSEVIPTGVQL